MYTSHYQFLDENGIQMMEAVNKVLNNQRETWRANFAEIFREGGPNLLFGTPEEWNQATGFLFCQWSAHGVIRAGLSITPIEVERYGFSTLVEAKFYNHANPNYSVDIFDAKGTKRYLKIRAVLD